MNNMKNKYRQIQNIYVYKYIYKYDKQIQIQIEGELSSLCRGRSLLRGTNRKVFKVKWSEADAQTIIFAEHKYEIYKHKYDIQTEI